MKELRASAVVLWLMAPLLLWLSAYRPAPPGGGRGAAIPTELRDARMFTAYAITPRQRELLGTDDAIWRAYRDPDGRVSYVVAVFHDANWKSVHPPRICIEGSGLRITQDDAISIEVGQRRLPAGRILAQRTDDGREYLSLYAFVTDGYVTASFGSYFWHHAPRALLRSATTGCLVRVEAWVDPAGIEATERRLAGTLHALVEAAERVLRYD